MHEMKNSGIEWIGDIPVGWELLPVKRFFRHTKRVVGSAVDEYERLALTMNGVIKRSKDDSEGLQPEKNFIDGPSSDNAPGLGHCQDLIATCPSAGRRHCRDRQVRPRSRQG